ncbi:hypothetical protein FIM07_01410 [SAR202 cluster bacterium AD-802-F09_MRT_200m]|nr:hypothetical protein [SAR202 cluster bacterium AD-802-F09_MRT_200m]
MGQRNQRSLISMFYRVLRSINRRAIIKKAILRDGIHGIIDRAYFKDNNGPNRENRKIIFHCLAWGRFLDWFFSYTVPSLLQDGNIPALARDGYEFKLYIYTHPEEFEEITEKYDSCLTRLKDYLPIEIVSLRELKAGWLTGHYWQSALIDQIKRCISEDATMFLTPPDTVFGNWSVSNAVKIVQGKNVCLAAAHARVKQESFIASNSATDLKKMDLKIENDELVDLAFEHGHEYLLGFLDDVDSNMTHGGISIRRINETTYSVVHNGPTPYLANFVKDDLKYFESSGSSWDNRWPRLLLRQNRLKVVGSSDSFFCVEITPDDGRHLTNFQSGSLNNDRYLAKGQRMLHNYVHNSFCCVWKGREGRPVD